MGNGEAAIACDEGCDRRTSTQRYLSKLHRQSQGAARKSLPHLYRDYSQT